jgi:hypothetical protein
MHFWGPALAAILCPKIAPVALQLCPIYQSPVPLLLFFSHYQNFRNGCLCATVLDMLGGLG